MMLPRAPLLFSPAFRAYVWGGRRLESLFGRVLPPGIVAESWELSGHPSSPTPVEGGPFDGTPLSALVSEYGAALLGHSVHARTGGHEFPLLVKLLDAAQPLSVQVHPDDAQARRLEGEPRGKTEMWYVLHAEEDAALIAGVRAGVTREDFRAALDAGDPGRCLHRLPVRAGDAVYIPAGTVHAILEGLVLAEIQQSSDTTYRVWDWGRVGADGRPRPLHVDKALEVIDFTRIAPGVQLPETLPGLAPDCTRERLTAAPDFHVERLRLAPGAEIRHALHGDGFEIWGCVSGSVRVDAEDGAATLPSIRFTLLPACIGPVTVTAGANGAVLLRVLHP